MRKLAQSAELLVQGHIASYHRSQLETALQTPLLECFSSQLKKNNIPNKGSTKILFSAYLIYFILI